MKNRPDIETRLKQVKLLAMDVDGVLTDGSIIYNEHGEEIKIFNVKDGLGIRFLIKAGLMVCIVTGRASGALLQRCRNLGIHHVYDGIADKAAILPVILKDMQVSAGEIAFIGDDLPDLPLMRQVGLSIGVSDAHDLIRQSADWITSAKGGAGAVREVCEMILNSKGLWNPALYSSL
ncbi:MAG: HAD-IIIA family hydrolase [Pseudomonadota bacterium]